MRKEIQPAPTTPSRFKELPFWKRASAIGLAVLATACGGTNGHETTTTIFPTTTSTTEPTTTTLPPTTTTEPTTTTVLEPTTTLPINITEPTGHILNNNTLLNLGLFKLEIYDYAPNQFSFNGRLINFYEEPYENFQGKNTTVIFADVVVGKYNDGSPIIIKVLLGRPEDLSLRIDTYGQDLHEASMTLQNFYPLRNLEGPLINSMLINYSQVGFLTFDSQTMTGNLSSFQNCIDVYSQYRPDLDSNKICEFSYEFDKYTENNKKLIELLEKDNKDPVDGLQNQIVSASGIILFTSS